MDANLGELTPGFGQRLDAAIKHRGLSIAELTRRSGISRWTIGNWLRERTRPEMNGLRRLAQVLDAKAEDLLAVSAEDEAVDTLEMFFAWKSQQQLQEIIHLRHVIETEVSRRLAEHHVERRRGRPRHEQ
jgi:transcriptional regulator with XRE-family HTH domain